ncbi:hypothetical protein ScPMuIL_005094 [Solemya velum]
MADKVGSVLGSFIVFVLAGLIEADTFCHGAYCSGNSYCCYDDPTECCYNSVLFYQFWWFWFLAVLFLVLMSSFCVWCCRRQRRLHNYTVFDTRQPTYGTTCTVTSTYAHPPPQYSSAVPGPPPPQYQPTMNPPPYPPVDSSKQPMAPPPSYTA